MRKLKTLSVTAGGFSKDPAIEARTHLKIVVFPRTKSRHNQFLEITSKSLESAGHIVRPWHQIFLHLRSPDLAILNWPENLWAPDVVSLLSRVKKIVLRRIFEFSLIRLNARGTKILWIAHNTISDWPRIRDVRKQEAKALSHYLRGVIFLTHQSDSDFSLPLEKGMVKAVIPHPQYPTVEDRKIGGRTCSITRLISLGGAHPSKNLRSFSGVVLDLSITSIVVTGRPGRRDRFDPGFNRDSMNRLGISLDLFPGFVPESTFKGLNDGQTAFLLCDPKSLNSGTLFWALSLGFPVVAPATPVNNEIQGEVGSEWLRLYSFPPSAGEINKLLAQAFPRLAVAFSNRLPSDWAREIELVVKRLDVTS